ncbi:hypothetical protein D9M72_547560 [compost metagenome]
MQKLVGNLACMPIGLLHFQSIDQFNRREEANPVTVVFDSLHPDGSGQVGLPRPGPANENNVVRLIEELASVQLANRRFIHLAVPEVEPNQVSVCRELGQFHLVGQ